MNLSELPKTTQRPAKRVGRGYGSGKGGHTSSRGTKGQKARGTVALAFEGTKSKKSFVKRLPFLRGRGKLKAWGGGRSVINLKHLADWPEKLEVTAENLLKQGLISRYRGEEIKLLGGGEITKALNVKITTSAAAAEKITKAGGKVWTNS